MVDSAGWEVLVECENSFLECKHKFLECFDRFLLESPQPKWLTVQVGKFWLNVKILFLNVNINSLNVNKYIY